MSAAITRLGNNNNLENIPHMLRLLANDLETGKEAMPRALILVSLPELGTLPDTWGFGKDCGRLESAGAMAFAMHQFLQTALVKE